MPEAAGKVDLKDIAEYLSLSTCTVSRILNNRMGSAKYKQETIERVKKAAKKLGYQPNYLARSLSMDKTMTVGLCVADIASPFFGRFAVIFQQEAARRGYSAFLCNTNSDKELEKRYLNELLSRRVDAVVVSSSLGAEISGWIEHARDMGRRVILFDREADGIAAPLVTVDNRAAMSKLARSVLNSAETGTVGVITGDPADRSLAQRLEGIRDALRDANIDEIHLVIAETGSTSAAHGRQSFRQLWEHKPGLVFSLACDLTVGAVQDAFSLRLEPGSDFRLACFDDFPGREWLRCDIPYVSQPVEQMAEICARLACQPEEPAVEHIVLPAGEGKSPADS